MSFCQTLVATMVGALIGAIPVSIILWIHYLKYRVETYRPIWAVSITVRKRKISLWGTIREEHKELLAKSRTNMWFLIPKDEGYVFASYPVGILEKLEHSGDSVKYPLEELPLQGSKYYEALSELQTYGLIREKCTEFGDTYYTLTTHAAPYIKRAKEELCIDWNPSEVAQVHREIELKLAEIINLSPSLFQVIPFIGDLPGSKIFSVAMNKGDTRDYSKQEE